MWVWITAFLLLACVPSSANEIGSIDQPSTPGISCGVNSAYAALRMLGVTVKWNEVASPKYISSTSGSTLADLTRACQDFGVDAVPLRGISVKALETFNGLVILNVKSNATSKRFDHWVLVICGSPQGLLVLDLPAEAMPMRPAKLLSLTNGVGLVVSNRDGSNSAADLQWIDLLSRLWMYVPIFAIIGLLRLFSLWHHNAIPTLKKIGQSCVYIVMVSVVCSLLVNFYSSIGLINHVEAETLTTPNDNFTQIGLAELKSAMEAGVLVIDARLPGDYDEDHIPGAVNIPAGAPESEVMKYVTSLGSAHGVVVYCSSNTCGSASQIAKLLVRNNITDVSIFSGGWVEWVKDRSRV